MTLGHAGTTAFDAIDCICVHAHSANANEAALGPDHVRPGRCMGDRWPGQTCSG